MKQKVSIKQWDETKRPREKLLAIGKQKLSDSELLAILIGSGNRQETAVDLCQRILDFANNDLNQLGKLSVSDLMQFKGIGEAKAISIVAALEIGRRRQPENLKVVKQIKSSKDCYQLLINYLTDLPTEEFWIVYLNQNNRVIGKEKISQGGVAGTVVDTRVVYKKALKRLATALIIAHNHPSGNLSPSQADKALTQKLKDAGKLLDIKLLDHLIISEEGYFSFADEGFL